MGQDYRPSSRDIVSLYRLLAIDLALTSGTKGVYAAYTDAAGVLVDSPLCIPGLGIIDDTTALYCRL